MWCLGRAASCISAIHPKKAQRERVPERGTLFLFKIMALASTLTQLEEVQAAITATLASQEYRLGDVTQKRAMLSTLTEREETLLARYNREQRGSSSSRANFNDGT